MVQHQIEKDKLGLESISLRVTIRISNHIYKKDNVVALEMYESNKEIG